MSNICVSSQEEKFIFVVDKYITHHRDSVNSNIFYRKLYVLFAGYHLKYFFPGRNIAIRVITLIISCRCLWVSFLP